MTLDSATLLITGSNRGLGRSLVEAGLQAGAGKIYASARRIADVTVDDPRIVPIELDICDPASIEGAREACGDVDIVINNAASLANASAYRAESLVPAMAEMQTNFWGLVAMCRAFAPLLTGRKGSAIVNILSMGALAGIPFCSSYCASKAAAWSFTQSLRLELAGSETAVLAAFPGPIATDMARPHEREGRWPANEVARAIYDGIARQDPHIFPDPVAQSVAAAYAADPWALPARFAGSTD
ncbi:MAG TPA: SDR family NAD(P)-dependent oxidoreductase [Sphingopyxis sp.]|uniref:SDR family NAD(P)-dependent oxidoreductase n=1 Tax=Sphingopyxis sp. TaxID=1908224 RepID=UPI002E2EE3B1|nr:SDR family NAD(P)-dependent oxidoreductase [Sphingopyxis sp.]HEX2813854.1 SDR family NAD(P)-dependent oxidoreductase [Sphingopyxis sp.]